MLREATHQDLDLLVRLGTKFAKNVQMDEKVEPSELRRALASMIDRPETMIFRTECGVIGACICPKFFNPKEMVAVEMFLYAEDGRGFELIKAFEDWALKQGAHFTVLGSVPIKRADVVERLYQRRGYKKVEVAYSKPVTA